MLKLVKKHCPNLQYIELELSEKNIKGVKSILAKVRSLRTVSIIASSIMGNDLGIVKLLKFQRNLKRLNLFHFCADEFIEVRNMVKLEELIICSRSDDINLDELCNRLKKLRKLQVIGKVFTASQEFKVAPCPALRELHLQARITPDVLAWILAHAETLERLKFNTRFYGYYDPNIVFSEVVSKCRNLRSLCMPIDQVNKYFIRQVIEFISESELTLKERPLDVSFHNPRMDHEIQKVLSKTSAKQVIALTDCF
ncbi:uncharacterized protein LOC110178977 [Drosophila serrata]|uniref:uncharacterized protein LOC110178977 n=1 Tax=Drosophila serrata TaxID=7274 RepID=UPI000A1D0D66|nr:uncharacterized protein LOC110178977 [Drosophila serrata]XP_020801948.1 uncharacterized protein LOC110178977 [Drosophila serrata]